MKTVIFPVVTVYGPGDEADWGFAFELSDDEYEQLKIASRSGIQFCKNENVADLYSQIYGTAVDESTKDFLESDPEYIEEFLEDDEDIEHWRADDTFTIKVFYPLFD